MDPRSSAGTSAYGSVGASGQFDPATFIRKPQVVLRIIGFVFSIVVFGCIGNQGWGQDHCFHSMDISRGVCDYGTAIGVLAFLLLLAFLGADAFFDNVSNVQLRKYIVIADILCFGIMSFLWFVSFCYMTAGWHTAYNSSAWYKSGVEAAIAFAFFSTCISVILTVLAILRYRKGVSVETVYGSGSDSYTDSGSSPF